MPPQEDNHNRSATICESDWFADIPSFRDFKDLTKDDFYRQAPDDWHLVITDVKGSTKAIEEGRYKDVNTIGAASISTVGNLLSPKVFPFVFGGDGATLLVSAEDIDRVLEVLLKLQVMAEQNFQLGLRVGHIEVGEVHKSSGKTIEVAKHEFVAGRCTAMFRGGGLTAAEAKIKGEEDKYCVQLNPTMAKRASLELSGLTCRMNPIPSKRGQIMSLLVSARCDSDKQCVMRVYTEVLRELDGIYQGRLEEANPLNTDLLTFKTAQKIKDDEKRYLLNTAPSQLEKRFEDVDYSVSIFKRDKEDIPSWAAHFVKEMRLHTDYRKFDDMLRMVIDCSEEQAGQIQVLLEQMRHDKKIYYGIFLSETALMTCYVKGSSDSDHISFVDGGDGGYAMAAKQFKQQLKGILE